MKRDLISSALAIVVLTLIFGLAYPFVITGISQVAWPNKADGSPSLLAQPRLNGKRPDPRYFQPRPSQDDYNPAATFFSNRGPNQRSAKAFYTGQLKAYLALERPYDPRLTAAGVPVDAVTTSASGVDPDISPANARIQAHRIAAVRHLSPATVARLIDENTDGRFLGVLGEPGVNVTTLNHALDHVQG
jgi:potassium-transporting ATPase KdpC subunit